MSTRPKSPIAADAFESLDEDDVAGFEAFADLLEAEAPPANGRETLLVALRHEGRLHRHADSVAELLDVPAEEARRLLDAAASEAVYEPGPFPSIGLYHVRGGPRVSGAITGFVRIPGGAEFPTHEHLGEEAVLVIQGSMLEPESGRIFRAGELARAEAGMRHTTVARPGPDLVYLAVLFDGLRVGDAELRADDPRL